MVKGRVAPSIVCFKVPLRIKNRYALIEQSAHLFLLKIGIY